jgi:phage recombination protein Bet
MTTDIATRGGSLAVAADQTWWTPEQQAVLQSTGIDQGVTQPELRAFLHEAQRTGLDPFTRQIYLIGRWDKRAGRKVYRSQTGIDGYRVIAHRAAERTGQQLSYDDTLWCGEDGAWRDVWLAKEAPAAAKVTVRRGAARFSAVAVWAEYVPLDRDGKPTGLWSKMGAVMIAKCAEALALRKAFPHDLAGIYTAEEMQQADAREPQAPRQMQRSRPQVPQDDEWSTPATSEPAELSERAQGWLRAIAEAGTPVVLGDIATQIKTDGGDLYAYERRTLLDAYEQRRAQLRDIAAQQAAPAPDAADTPTEAAPPKPDTPDPDPDPELDAARAEVADAVKAAQVPWDEVERAFAQAHGHSLDVATVAELRETRDLLLGQVSA